jgi:hypothetical protein
MKPQGMLLVVLLLVPLLSCEEDVPLGEALTDVRSAAPTVCKDYCAWAQTCVWNSFDFETAGIELEAAKQDWQQACVVTCANRSSKGTFVYEYEWGQGEEPDVCTFTEQVKGKPWTAYFKCLWENSFWQCGEHGYPELVVANEADCTAYDTCVQILEVAMQYNWNPEGGGGEGACHHDGFDHLWDGWTSVW